MQQRRTGRTAPRRGAMVLVAAACAALVAVSAGPGSETTDRPGAQHIHGCPKVRSADAHLLAHTCE